MMRAIPALFVTSLVALPAAAQQQPMELVVNIPAGRLSVYQGGTLVKSYPVSVGTSRHATPTANAAVRRMVWNPSWTPPPDAEWARNEKPKGPGWGNPMGRVKMHLFDDYYVHGTPASNEHRLGRPASHGCIRMRNQDVMELAQMVLRADGAPVAQSTVDYLVNHPRATRELALQGRVRVRIEYRLADVTADSVTLHPDVYGKAGRDYASRVTQELTAAGADGTALVTRLAIERAPSAAVRVARDSAAASAATAAPAAQDSAPQRAPAPASTGTVTVAANTATINR